MGDSLTSQAGGGAAMKFEARDRKLCPEPDCCLPLGQHGVCRQCEEIRTKQCQSHRLTFPCPICVAQTKEGKDRLKEGRTMWHRRQR